MYNRVKIVGYSYYIPNHKVVFGNQIRWREEEKTQLDMAELVSKEVLQKTSLSIKDIDLIVSTSAVGVQPIPCTAALIHERIAKGYGIPAMDINTTCTSFITAFDTISYLIEAGRYQRVLLIASEIGSQGLNSSQKESYELFSDGACAYIIEKTEEDKGVKYALQETWSEGVHSTEIRGGLTGFHPKYYQENTKREYMFDMHGKSVLLLSMKKLPDFFKRLKKESGIEIQDIAYVVPHQASKALELVMKYLGIEERKYINLIQEYGNMVSVSIPFALAKALEFGKIQEGDTILLIGTAAGLTFNALILKM